MKKTVAVFIVLFVIAMGVMVGWGFIDKQLKENAEVPAPTSTTTPQSSNQPTSSEPGTSTPSNTSTPSYTLSDLAKHKTQNDCWIAVNGNVYDVTKYLDFHPGGADLILMQCGKDATVA